MYIADLVELVMNLPKEISEAEGHVIAATREFVEAEEELVVKESSLILEGQITGKNDTERKAQLANMTAEERRKVAEAKEKLSVAKNTHTYKTNMFRAARVAAQLISQFPDEIPTAGDQNNESAA